MKTDKLRSSIYSKRHLQFRELIISARKTQNLSQKALSEKLGVHHSMIGKIETDDRKLGVLDIDHCDILKSIKPDN